MKPDCLPLFQNFLKIGLTAFGSGTSEVLIEEIVERKQWLTLEQFQSGMAMAGMSPGPFHLNLVMNLGYQIRGYPGMVLSLMGYILPSFLLVLGIAYSLTSVKVTSFLQEHPGIILGLVAGTAGLLATAIRKLWVRSAPTLLTSFLVLLVAGVIFWLKTPFILIILLSGGVGILVFYIRSRLLKGP